MDNTVQKIEKARQDLNEIGMQKGFQDPEVMKQSQMLDELINLYYRSRRNRVDLKQPVRLRFF